MYKSRFDRLAPGRFLSHDLKQDPRPDPPKNRFQHRAIVWGGFCVNYFRYQVGLYVQYRRMRAEGGKICELGLTCGACGGRMQRYIVTRRWKPVHIHSLSQRAAGWCEAVKGAVWNSFRSGLSQRCGDCRNPVGKDGKSPIQLADLLGSREAPFGSKLRWYHRNFLSSAYAGDFCFIQVLDKMV